MSDISVFCDESGGENGHSEYCLVTLVFHDQEDDITDRVDGYRRALDSAGLLLIPFHASPCMYGKDGYKDLDISVRKGLIMKFFMFQRALPYRYKTFAYRRKEVADTSKFTARLKRDLAVFLTDNLEYFQSFDQVKIYYDGGQPMVTQALHAAIDYVLSKNAVLYREASAGTYCLQQVADLICTLELTDIKFEQHTITATDEKFFGLSRAAFKKLYLRHVRAKLL